MIISEYSNFLYRISVNKENTLELLRPFSLDAWVALKLDRWNTHKWTSRVWYLPAISNFHPSLPSPPSSEKTFFVADGKSTQCFKSLKSIDSAGPTDLDGDSHCSAAYLKTKARLGTGLQHDKWFSGSLHWTDPSAGMLWCHLVGSSFGESDEARRAYKNPCLNLKYRFKVKLKAK